MLLHLRAQHVQLRSRRARSLVEVAAAAALLCGGCNGHGSCKRQRRTYSIRHTAFLPEYALIQAAARRVQWGRGARLLLNSATAGAAPACSVQQYHQLRAWRDRVATRLARRSFLM